MALSNEDAKAFVLALGDACPACFSYITEDKDLVYYVGACKRTLKGSGSIRVLFNPCFIHEKELSQ